MGVFPFHPMKKYSGACAGFRPRRGLPVDTPRHAPLPSSRTGFPTRPRLQESAVKLRLRAAAWLFLVPAVVAPLLPAPATTPAALARQPGDPVQRYVRAAHLIPMRDGVKLYT